jgi:biotin-(acetyl-CoA carboxylase) ligase
MFTPEIRYLAEQHVFTNSRTSTHRPALLLLIGSNINYAKPVFTTPIRRKKWTLKQSKSFTFSENLDQLVTTVSRIYLRLSETMRHLNPTSKVLLSISKARGFGDELLSV